MSKIIQFNWSRNWKKKVEPHLGIARVRASVELGMKLYDPDWTWDDGPHAIGRGCLNGQRVVRNKLSWFQPWGRCHWISLFSCAIGALNYPELDWQFISGHCHTIPVGSWNGEQRVVMDILNFKGITAEKSIALARLIPPGVKPRKSRAGKLWKKLFTIYVQKWVPARANASNSSRIIATRLISTSVHAYDSSRTYPFMEENHGRFPAVFEKAFPDPA